MDWDLGVHQSPVSGKMSLEHKLLTFLRMAGSPNGDDVIANRDLEPK